MSNIVFQDYLSQLLDIYNFIQSNIVRQQLINKHYFKCLQLKFSRKQLLIIRSCIENLESIRYLNFSYLSYYIIIQDIIKDQFVRKNLKWKMENMSEGVLQFEKKKLMNKIDISFQNISQYVEINGHQRNSGFYFQKVKKQLLTQVSGICKGCEITAIMGVSGSGKTTLLNVITQKVKQKSGSVFANNKVFNREQFGNFGNYLPQNDVLMQFLTVRETLQFAGNLKIQNQKQRHQKINEIILNLKLQKCLDTLVGGTMVKGLSGGQKKRTGIAFQLISDSQVIVLDEPTSGLDSLTAFVIIKYLQKLARQSIKTVILTIHQPNKQIFDLLDRLLLLQNGRLVYQGPTQQSINYFSSLGVYFPQYRNPSELLIDLVHETNSIQNQSLNLIQKYTLKIETLIKHQIESANIQEFDHNISQISFWIKLKTLLYRDYINCKRNPLVLKTRLIQSLVMGLFQGGLFFQLSKDYTPVNDLNSQNFRSMLGALTSFSLKGLLGSIGPSSLVFPHQRQVFLKESNSKLYGVGPYYLSHCISQIPYLIIDPLIFSTIVYLMAGLTLQFQKYLILYAVVALMTLVGSSLGMLVGSILKDTSSVRSLLPLIVFPVIMLSGFFKNRQDLPTWIGWIQYLSPCKYSLMALAQNELKGIPSPLNYLNFEFGVTYSIFIIIAYCIIVRVITVLILYIKVKA